MNVSKFAPESLIKEHNDLLNALKSNAQEMDKYREYRERKIIVLEKLCTHPNMEIVWRRIAKRKIGNRKTGKGIILLNLKDKSARSDTCQLYASMIDGFLVRDKFSYLPVSERLKKGQQLIDSMNLLANDLEKFDIGKHVIDYLDTDTQKKLINRTENPKHKEDVYDSMLRWFQLANDSQSVSDILRNCSKKLDDTKPYTDVPISHVNSASADAVYFVRKLANWNAKYFGLPLYEITALIADVFFPDSNFTEKKVMNILK